MPAWIAGGIAASGLLGDMFSSSGQQATNAQNMQIAQMNNQFNAQQAQLNRNFQEQMSDTAMTRRVQDLKNANLNPLLAIGAGGASSPTGSSAQSVGLPSVQNPNQSFSNAGAIAGSAAGAATTTSQIAANTASAQQASAQAALATASAGKIAGVDTRAQEQNINESQTRQVLMGAQSDAASAQAQLSVAQVRVADAQLPKITAEIARLGAATNLDQVQSVLTDLNSELQGLTIQQFKYLSPSLIQSASNAASSSSLDLIMKGKQAQAASGTFGTVAPYIDRITNWLHLGANIVK